MKFARQQHFYNFFLKNTHKIAIHIQQKLTNEWIKSTYKICRAWNKNANKGLHISKDLRVINQADILLNKCFILLL